MAATPHGAKQFVLIVNDYDLWRKPTDLIQYHAEPFHSHGLCVASVYGDRFMRMSRPIFMLDWMAGDNGDYWPAISEQGLAFIDSVIHSGSHLLLSGSNFGNDVFIKGSYAEKIFFANTFQSVCRSNAPADAISTFYQMEPVSGSLFSGLGPIMFDDGSKYSYNVYSPDVIDPKFGGRAELTFTGALNSTAVGCVSCRGTIGPDGQTGHIVYFTVPFECIWQASTQWAIVERVLDFFSGQTNIQTDVNVPEQIAFIQNYPNPFNVCTIIQYSVPATSECRMDIINLNGRRIITLVNRQLHSGSYQIRWDGRNDQGDPVATGTYFCRLTAGSDRVVHKMLYVK